jgi:hypothetical protein
MDIRLPVLVPCIIIKIYRIIQTIDGSALRRRTSKALMVELTECFRSTRLSFTFEASFIYKQYFTLKYTELCPINPKSVSRLSISQ